VSFRTPAQIDAFVKKTMFRLDQPMQYAGTEPNSYRKPWESASVTVCLFACWAYEPSAGNLAIPLVYRTINEHRPQFLCDRSYFHSTPRDLRAFEKAGIPVFGVESKHQLMDFDVIGTSISYPVLSVNLIKQLRLSDIPPTWADRTDADTGETVPGRHRNPEAWPFVIVGGQLYGAPEVAANVVDAVFCGEAEDEPDNPGIGAVLDRVEVMKEAGLWSTERMECYKKLAMEFHFLYFPCFIDVHYGYERRPSVEVANESMSVDETHPSKQVVGYTSKIPGMRVPIVKRFVKDLDSVKGLENPPLLFINPGMGAGDLEVQRGCPAWCSFCALSWRQKPYRQRSVEKTVEAGSELVRNTGALHLAPFGPDFPMHTQKKRLISALLENVTDDVDAASMRVDDFIADPSFILLQAHGGMDSVTLGVEGNSQRMRDLVGKGAADEDVKEAVARGIRAGLTKFKLYMIADLPGEDEHDIYHILKLAKDLADIRDALGSNARIQFSWTPMLIEGNTPFQWFSPTTSNWALGDVWEDFRDLKIDFKLGGKSQKDKLGYFQLTQRASREVGMAMVEAVCQMNQGCWGGAPRGLFDLLEVSLKRRGFLNGFADCYDERQKHDMFGWEMVDQGVNTELMWVTYQQMKEFLEVTDSKTYDLNFGVDYHGNEWLQRCDDRCYGKVCGVCDVEDLKIRRGYIQGASEEISVDLNNVKVVDQKSVAMKIRAKVVKSTENRFVDGMHYKYATRRAAYRVGLPITKRTVKFSSEAGRMRDWTCGVDFVEFGLTRRLTKAQITPLIEAMNVELHGPLKEPSMEIVDWSMLPSLADSLRTDVDLSLFDMEVDLSKEVALAAIKRWHEADYVKMVFKEESAQPGYDTKEEVNGKDYVDDLWLVKDGHRLVLRALVRGKANPYVLYAALFAKKSWVEAAKYPAVRVEAFIEADGNVIDSFRPVCVECGLSIPVNPLDTPYDLQRCPRCLDDSKGMVVKEFIVT